MHWDFRNYMWGTGLGWLVMFVFWVLVILLVTMGIVYLVRQLTEGKRKQRKEESALDILKKRYAKGEITKEEFEKIRDDIMRG
jgi:putative membrane protein